MIFGREYLEEREKEVENIMLAMPSIIFVSYRLNKTIAILQKMPKSLFPILHNTEKIQEN